MSAPNCSDAFCGHFLLPFELDGWQHPVPHMLSRRIVEHFYIVEHILLGFGSGPVSPAPYPLSLQQVEEALRDGIVMAVSAPALLAS